MSELVSKRFALITNGQNPALDALSIIVEVMKPLSLNEREANLYYLADLYGFKTYRIRPPAKPSEKP